MYEKQWAKIKAAGTTSDWFKTTKGVRQGCVISPYLFNTLAEMVMQETLEDIDGGITLAGRRITNLRNADDIILLVESAEKVQ